MDMLISYQLFECPIENTNPHGSLENLVLFVFAITVITSTVRWPVCSFLIAARAADATDITWLGKQESLDDNDGDSIDVAAVAEWLLVLNDAWE